jgi:hypothetical protein
MLNLVVRKVTARLKRLMLSIFLLLRSYIFQPYWALLLKNVLSQNLAEYGPVGPKHVGVKKLK